MVLQVKKLNLKNYNFKDKLYKCFEVPYTKSRVLTHNRSEQQMGLTSIFGLLYSLILIFDMII